MSNRINYPSGYWFTRPMRIGALAIFCLGLALFVNGSLKALEGTSDDGIVMASFGVLPFFLGMFIATARSGLLVNMNERTVRCYNAYFGLSRFEKPVSLDVLPFVTVLKKGQRHGLSTSAMTYDLPVRPDVFNTYTDWSYHVTLLGQLHRRKLAVHGYKSVEEAMKAAQKLVEQLGVTYARYSPHVSERTKRRRQGEQRERSES